MTGGAPNPSHAPAQDWDAARYANDFRFIGELGRPVIALLDPKPGERVLDLGCGDGGLSLDLACTGVDLVCVDADPAMVDMARGRGLSAYRVNAHDLPYDSEFDAVFSNAALHWMKDADAVIAGVARALRSGGRFVAEFGGAGNVQAERAALIAALDRRGLHGASVDPWFFPSDADYRVRLERAGFRVESISLFPRPTPLPVGLRHWLDTFGKPFLAQVPEAERGVLLDEVTEACRPVLQDASGAWHVDYVRLRFRAVLT